MAKIIRRVVIRAQTESLPEKSYPVVKCQCGAHVHCSESWANDCQNCGTEFNGSGQTLAARRFWGEETGECYL